MAWKYGLLSAMKDPSLLLYSDEQVSIIKDCYPKAEMHLLVISVADIADVKSLRKEHVPLIKKMEVMGKDMGDKLCEGRKFRIGFHVVPSMHRLHLHVITDDFNSPSLKTLKHWNSFNTSFFVPPNKVISELETHGRVRIPSEKEVALLLTREMKCNKCDFRPKHIPELKRHVITHL